MAAGPAAARRRIDGVQAYPVRAVAKLVNVVVGILDARAFSPNRAVQGAAKAGGIASRKATMQSKVVRFISDAASVFRWRGTEVLPRLKPAPIESTRNARPSGILRHSR
jgi:hypothetical protein